MPGHIQQGKILPMNETTNGIPHYIRTAFRIPDEPGKSLGSEWDYGIRVGSMVVSPVIDREVQLVSCRIRETIRPEFTRLARPIHSTDGRLIVRGYKVTDYIPGVSRTNPDQVIHASFDIDRALKGVEIPRFVDYLPDFNEKAAVFRTADHAAWSEKPAEVIGSYVSNPEFTKDASFISALETIAAIFPRLEEIDAPRQLMHADMWGTTLIHSSLPPSITDFYLQAHPAGYSAALVAIDALGDRAASPKILNRYSFVPHWEQLILRALSYRLYTSALRCDSTAIERFVELAHILEFVD